jgi:hypothetical protein
MHCFTKSRRTLLSLLPVLFCPGFVVSRVCRAQGLSVYLCFFLRTYDQYWPPPVLASSAGGQKQRNCTSQLERPKSWIWNAVRQAVGTLKSVNCVHSSEAGYRRGGMHSKCFLSALWGPERNMQYNVTEPRPGNKTYLDAATWPLPRGASLVWFAVILLRYYQRNSVHMCKTLI